MGKWTRIQGDQKSVIDYAMVDKKDEEYLIEMYIDEDKIKTPYHITKDGPIYTDHCAIMIKMDWNAANKIEVKNNINITKDNINKFKEKTNENILTKIVRKKGNIKEKYSKWQKTMNEIMKKSFYIKKNPKKKQPKTIEILLKKKRKMKKEMKKEVNDKKRKQLLKVQLTLMEEYIWKEEAKNNVKNIEKELEKLKKAGGTNSNAFWEFKKQIEKKNKKEELPKSMKNKEGKVKTEKNEIIKIFEEFYEELFINIDEESVNSVRAKEIREIIFNSIKSLAKMEKTETPITKKEIIETINELKNKNTRDSQVWSNVILKNA